MRVLTIVGLLLIATVAFAATKDKSVEQTQNDDALKVLFSSWYHDALDKVCEAVKADAEKRENCRRSHWALYREVRIVVASIRRYHNEAMHRFGERHLFEIRDHLIKYAPVKK